jgi:Flp pilus assembly protein TadB
MRERKGADRKDLGIAGGFILAAIVSALVWRHSLLEIAPFLVGATLGFWLIVRACKRSSDRRQ